MGWSVPQVKATSMWEFFAAWDGFVDANSSKGSEKLSADEIDDLWAFVDDGYSAAVTVATKTYVWGGLDTIDVEPSP